MRIAARAMGYSKGASIDDFHGVYLVLLPEGTIWHVLCAKIQARKH